MFEGNERCDAERLGNHSVSKYLLRDRDLLLLDTGTSHTQLDTGRQEDEIKGKLFPIVLTEVSNHLLLSFTFFFTIFKTNFDYGHLLIYVL